MHMDQLMPLPLTVCCFSKIQITYTFLVQAYPGSPRKRAVKRGGAENARHARLENAGRSKMHGRKTRDWKTQQQTAGLVNAGKACMESQTVYFTCSI